MRSVRGARYRAALRPKKFVRHSPRSTLQTRRLEAQRQSAVAR